jgi:hypothetical protein
LSENKQGSLEFDGEFHGHPDMQPQAYYSESHLDTLGLCVFLGLAKYFNHEDMIVVLDDVLTSVDQVHLDRVLNMISNDKDNFNQIIITTHYRPWRDKYRYSGGVAQLVELLPWSLSKGVRHTKTKLAADEIRDLLNVVPIDRQAIASKSGILLESLLDFLTMHYSCSLPRNRESNYTLGDYNIGLGSSLKKNLKVQKQINGTNQDIILNNILEFINVNQWIRNQVGCHFSIEGQTLSDAEVIGMGESTLKLADAIICSDCGELPYRNKNGTYWHCKCENTKLNPYRDVS